MSAPTKIFIVDRYRLIRQALQSLLTNQGLKVVADVELSDDAVKQYRSFYPAIITVGMNLHDVLAERFIKRVRQTYPDVRILVVSNGWHKQYVRDLLQLGVSGCVMRTASVSEFVQAIRVLGVGQRYIAPQIAREIVLKDHTENNPNNFQRLSQRELMVAKMILSGKDTKEMAELMDINGKTVNSYRYRIYQKLKISSDVELVHYAMKHGILDIHAHEENNAN